MDTTKLEELEEKARLIRKGILEIMAGGKRGHLGGSMSSAEVVAALYFHQLRHNPKNPYWEERDRFIMSKGHSVLAQYVALAELEYFPKEELRNVKKLGCILEGHPDMRKISGVEASTGSLGQGLSIGCGVALGAKLKGEKYRVYVLVGDGESNEGMIWEAAFFAAHYKLDNLTALTDRNGLMATGPTMVDPLAEKWRAFGWWVTEIDGHNIAEILDALDRATRVKNQPTMIVCRTVKGKGVSFIENVPDFHHVVLNEEQHRKALDEVLRRT